MKQRIKFRLNEILISGVSTVYGTPKFGHQPNSQQFTKFSATFCITHEEE